MFCFVLLVLLGTYCKWDCFIWMGFRKKSLGQFLCMFNSRVQLKCVLVICMQSAAKIILNRFKKWLEKNTFSRESGFLILGQAQRLLPEVVERSLLSLLFIPLLAIVFLLVWKVSKPLTSDHKLSTQEIRNCREIVLCSIVYEGRR